MNRMYVIMCDTPDEEGFYNTYPVDVSSSIARAEDLCFQYENENPDNIYYYREVITSE